MSVLNIVPKEKVCSKCKVSKPFNEFAKCSWRKIGITPACKDCRNKAYKDPRSGSNKGRPDKLMRLYGVTYEEVQKAFDAQHGLCANRGCGEAISLDGPHGKGRAYIDHCHKTGKFRALLCNVCNMLLGKVENDKNRLLGLMEYEEKFNRINGQ